jgi:hypothetical protein
LGEFDNSRAITLRARTFFIDISAPIKGAVYTIVIVLESEEVITATPALFGFSFLSH